MVEPLRIVIVEDIAEDAELALRTLRQAGIEVSWQRVETAGQLLASLADARPDLILSDYSLPAFDGMAALALARAHAPDVPFIVCTGSLNEETAVSCMKAGAWDYILKDRLTRLPMAVRAALDLARTRSEKSQAEASLRATQALSQSIIDSLASSVAVITPSGEIIQVNRAWREFAEHNGGSEAVARGIGLDYFGTTGAAVPEPTAAKALEGMKAVLGGEMPSFALEYPCSSPGVERWFLLTVTRLHGARAGLVALHTDISERKRAEAALAESEERYRLVLEHSFDALLMGTPDGAILSANPAACTMFGCSEEELCWLGRAGLLDGADPRVGLGVQERERTGEFIGEVTGLRADGTRFPIEVSSTIFRDARGDLRSSISMRDITARKLAEQGVEKERARFRTLTESAPFGMRLSDASGTVTYVNPAWTSLFGYTAEETPTLEAWRALAYPEAGRRAEMEARWRADQAARERGESVTKATRPTCRNGALKSVLMTSVMLEQGQVLTTCVDMTDITAAQEAQRRLAAAIEQAAEVVVITDRAGVIEYVNPAFERVTGYSREEAVGESPRILKSGNQDAAFYQDLWRTITAGRTWHGHFVNRRKAGTLYEEDATITPIRDERGEVVNFVAIKRDVSREVELQQQLVHAQKMEAVGRLAGGIAHDFNNLLQAMLGQLAVLRQRVTIPDDHAARSFGELDELVRRGAALTRQLLLFSRRETSLRERVDLNDAVRGAASLLRRIVRENVTIDTELAPAPLPVVADRAQLDQVLMNLAVNASDAMASGGRMTLRTEGDETHVRLVVADTGCGMSDVVRAHVFEPFFTTKAVGKGTGLGLSVVHGIVTAHGGRLEVESREGEGATFTVLLPRDLHAAAGTAAAAVPPGGLQHGGGERVLVLEDEAGAREGLAEVLSLLGYVVVAVEDGARALALPEAPPFDLVISDLMLPGMSGPDVAAELERRWPALRVILMSGYAEDEAVRRSASVGDVRFLQKPFDVPTLAAAVRSALDERERER
jgi:two-component system, cell cycle sensor histidine kinase and response regulator CckA